MDDLELEAWIMHIYYMCGPNSPQWHEVVEKVVAATREHEATPAGRWPSSGPGASTRCSTSLAPP